jgi:hypothetical protein
VLLRVESHFVTTQARGAWTLTTVEPVPGACTRAAAEAAAAARTVLNLSEAGPSDSLELYNEFSSSTSAVYVLKIFRHRCKLINEMSWLCDYTAAKGTGVRHTTFYLSDCTAQGELKSELV